ncbi:MAG: hypothetical protein OXE04_08440 [bacterium]|nr:hypothetical protein [bacterium]
MFLWFVALSFVLVAMVFNSPALDYRFVIAGAVLPTVELLADGPYVLHTLLAPFVVLTVVMLATRGHRLIRRRWLGFPIGLFMYLVLDGAWLRTELFWWPAWGLQVGSANLPQVKPLVTLIAMEVAGLIAALWAVRRYSLNQRQHLSQFAKTGRLPRT